MKILFLLLCCSLSFASDATRLAAIAGPTLAAGAGPWGYYNDTSTTMTREVADAALSYTPTLGTALSGTFDLDTTACGITLTGAGASAVTGGDVLIVAIDTVDGSGAGRFPFYVGSVVGNVITSSNQCGHVLIASQSGVTVYRCSGVAGCYDEIATATPGINYYYCGSWMICGSESSWNFYDFGAALYHLYQQTGDVADRTRFRDFTDTFWLWGTISGNRYLENAPRGSSFLSQYMRALDGHSERLAPLHANVTTFYTSGYPNGSFDNRESGYVVLFLAVGARADSDATRHSDYCTKLNTVVNLWVDYYNAVGRPGYFPEKNTFYPYTTMGVSPWRSFSILQGLARAYDVFIDTDTANGGCNDTSLASDVLDILNETGEFLYSAGYAPTTRGVYYDIEFPVNGVEGGSYGTETGTVSISSGTTVTGSGTSFTTTFACDGTDFIGILGGDGVTFTHKVSSCADNTHLTIATAWGTQCYYASTYAVPAVTQYCEGAMSARPYYQADPSSSSCESAANYCYSADKNSARDLIWIMGWLYKTTSTAKWKTYGDELFATSVGGPGDGAGGSSACSGPNCWSTETDYVASLHGCATDPTLPCNTLTNYGVGNVWVYGGKRLAQMDGIGGASNYLFWRTTPTGDATPPRVEGDVKLSGGARI